MDSFIKHVKTDSTNDDAMEFVKNGIAFDGLSVFTGTQIRGRGRRINKWVSEPGKNIALSVVTSMQAHPLSHQPILSMITGLSVLKLIESHTDLQPQVKWPNDVFILNKKIAGILIENVLSGQTWKWAVSGFGININQVEFGANQYATSLLRETGKSFDIEVLAMELKNIFLQYLNHWKDHDWLALYNNHLYKREQKVKMKYEGEIFETTILGVDIKGNLITEDKTVRKWVLSEVKMLLED